MYEGKLKSNAQRLVEHEQKQKARLSKKCIKVQLLSFNIIYLFFDIVKVKTNSFIPATL